MIFIQPLWGLYYLILLGFILNIGNHKYGALWTFDFL